MLGRLRWYLVRMLFEGDKVILCHGVVDLRKGA